MATPDTCDMLGGTPQGPGSACQGDLNGDGVDDGCTCAAPPPDMVAWWPLDLPGAAVTQVDLVNGNNAVPSFNRPNFLPGEFVGNSRCFVSSVQESYKVRNDSALNFGTGDLSIDAWVRTSNTGGGFRFIVEKRFSGTLRGYALFLTGGQLGFQLADADSLVACSTSCPTTAPCTNWITTGQNVADGNWHHVAATLNRVNSQGLHLYVDGNLAGTFNADCHPNTITNKSMLNIGSRGLVQGGFFDGCIDEVELFDRALSGTEIRAIYNAGILGKCLEAPEACCFANGSCSEELPSACSGMGGTSQGTGSTCHGDNNGDGIDDVCVCTDPPPGLIAWWPLDETAGTIAGERVNGMNGTYVSNPTPSPGEFVGNSLCCGSFEGVSIPHDQTLNFGPGDFSIDAWIRTGNLGLPTIVQKVGFVTATEELGFRFSLKAGLLAFRMTDGIGPTSCSSSCSITPIPQCTEWVSTGPNVSDGRWHHVAVTADRDSPVGLVLYVDGVSVGTFDPTCHQGSITNTTMALTFVTGITGLCLDEVELFNRALLPSEVQAIYFAEARGKCKVGPKTSKTFCINGTSNGDPYAWRLTGPTLFLEELSAPPVLPVGSGAEALAAAFVESLNSVGPADLAKVQTASPNCFTVTILDNNPFALEVGVEGDPTLCCVTCSATIDGCSYNPTITEMRATIPAVSDWGLVAMVLLLLCAATVVLQRARRTYGPSLR